MATLTAEQTLDMLGDLAAGALDDVFSQDELQRLYDRAGDDYNLAVYYGWRQVAANSVKWIDYQVAQTKISRIKAAEQLKLMLELWAEESKTANNQFLSVGMNGVPAKYKNKPHDQYPHPRHRNRFYPYVS